MIIFSFFYHLVFRWPQAGAEVRRQTCFAIFFDLSESKKQGDWHLLFFSPGAP